MSDYLKVKVKLEGEQEKRRAALGEKRAMPAKTMMETGWKVLGVPFGGPVEGRDADGEAFHEGTETWLEKGGETPITYYHGFGPDDPFEWQERPAVIGKAVYTGADERGHWFDVFIDGEEELGRRVMAAGAEGVRASSGAAGHLVRMSKANLIDVWPVAELALFDVNEWRQPANEWAVVEMKKSEAEESGKAEAEAEASGDLQSLKASRAVLNDESDEPGEGSPEGPQNGDAVKTDEVEEVFEMNAEEILALAEQLKPMIGEQVKSAVAAAIPAPEEVGGVKSKVEVVVDEADQPFETAGKFFQAVKMAALYPGQEDRRLKGLKATGANEAIPAEGGYLVPAQTAGGILERMYKTGELLSRISLDNVSGNSMTYNAVNETSRVTGSRWGGVQGYWLAEAATITSSKPAFRQIELKLKKCAALCYATDELLEDVAALESWLTRTVPEELRFQVEDAIFEGDGVGKPLGIMNSPCLVAIQRDTATYIKAADIANMWARRWPGVSDYVWLISPSAAAQLPQMSIGNFPVYLPPTGFRDAGYGTMLGRPVLEVEYAAALNTTGDLMLASLSQYQAIGKGGVKSAQSIHVAFTTDESAFRFTYRFDGQPTWHSALTPLHGSDTLSPFVVMGSASA